MTRLVLSTALIVEAARRGRLTLGPLGVQLDGAYVDEQGGHEVVELIDAGYLAEDGGRLVPGPDASVAALTIDGFCAKYALGPVS